MMRQQFNRYRGQVVTKNKMHGSICGWNKDHLIVAVLGSGAWGWDWEDVTSGDRIITHKNNTRGYFYYDMTEDKLPLDLIGNQEDNKVRLNPSKFIDYMENKCKCTVCRVDVMDIPSAEWPRVIALGIDSMFAINAISDMSIVQTYVLIDGVMQLINSNCSYTKTNLLDLDSQMFKKDSEIMFFMHNQEPEFDLNSLSLSGLNFYDREQDDLALPDAKKYEKRKAPVVLYQLLVDGGYNGYTRGNIYGQNHALHGGSKVKDLVRKFPMDWRRVFAEKEINTTASVEKVEKKVTKQLFKF